jgi:hypothetical protein
MLAYEEDKSMVRPSALDMSTLTWTLLRRVDTEDFYRIYQGCTYVVQITCLWGTSLSTLFGIRCMTVREQRRRLSKPIMRLDD